MENISLEIGKASAILLVFILILAACIGYAVFQYILRVPSSGKVVTIGVQLKDELGNLVKHIDWGELTPNSKKDYHVFAVNNGSIPITLTLTTENWNPPEASNYISLTWDYLGGKINPGETYPITFSLIISENPSFTSFSFDIVITATEVS